MTGSDRGCVTCARQGLDEGRAERTAALLDQILSALGSWITWVISSGGYLGVLLLMAVESACIPLPSEIIMPFAGYLVSTGRFSLVGVATAGALGCNLGSTVAYLVGARGGRAAIEHWGAYVLLSSKDLDWSERFFRRFGRVTVLVSRLLPVVRTFIALPAGVARMPMVPFQVLTFVGSWIWCFALAWIGFKLGERWDQVQTLRTTFHRFDAAIVAVLVVGAAWFVWHRLHGMRRSRPS